MIDFPLNIVKVLDNKNGKSYCIIVKETQSSDTGIFSIIGDVKEMNCGSVCMSDCFNFCKIKNRPLKISLWSKDANKDKVLKEELKLFKNRYKLKS